MNKIIMIGNVATDPQSHTTQAGVSLVRFRIAVQRRFKDSSGQRVSDFFDAVAWRNTADYVSRFVQKGDRVGIDGSLQTRQYDTQDGRKATAVEIVVESIDHLTRRNAETQSAGTEGTTDRPGFTEVQDDELPF